MDNTKTKVREPVVILFGKACRYTYFHRLDNKCVPEKEVDPEVNNQENEEHNLFGVAARFELPIYRHGDSAKRITVGLVQSIR